MNKRRIVRLVIGLAIAAVSCVGAFVGFVVYANRSAERSAQEFCDATPIGSDISASTARANNAKILWGSEGDYTFYFSGFIFDKAVCAVSVNKEGKVTSKKAEMEYD